MARVNIDILGISKLKWTGMGEFNSNDHYIYYCGKESLRRNWVAIIINKGLKMQYLDATPKWQNDLCLSISQNPSFVPTSNAEEAEVDQFYEDLQDLLELTPKKGGDWNAKVGSQETPRVTGKFGLGVQNEARQRLIEFSQETPLVMSNTHFQQYKRRLYTYTSPDGQYQNQIDNILCSQRWRSFIQSAKTRLGSGCGSDHELLIAKFRLKLKMVGKNHLTIQVWSESNPLLLYSRSDKSIQGIRSDRQSAWRTMDRCSWYCTGGSEQDHPQERNSKRQNGCLRRPYK